MIPQRVAIEGFLSYRGRVEFCFDEARIWMLTGENGAGKSTVFDAMLFALYGVHRGGKQDVEQLINSSSDRLSLEFDFALGSDCYRVQRTASRQGGKSYQAFHLSGPNPPNPKRASPQPIPETDSKDGLRRWVLAQLGLNEEAFRMSVLLQQGKSEALLDADPRERHALLGQLVDLSRYQRLHDRAQEQMRKAKGQSDQLGSELAGLAAVEDAQLAQLDEQAADAKSKADALQTQIETLIALKVHAKRWSDLTAERARLLTECEDLRKLIDQADQIKRDAARQRELAQVLPRLERIARDQQEYQTQQHAAACRADKVADLDARLAALRPERDRLSAEVKRLQAEKDTAQQQATLALARLRALDADIGKINELATLQQTVTACEQALAEFAPDLDQQLAQVQDEASELEKLYTVQPFLSQYASARRGWHRAGDALRTAEQEHCQAQARRAEADTNHRQAEANLEAARAARSETEKAKAIAEAALAQTQTLLTNLDDLDGQPTCPHCGQALTPTHLAAERQRLDQELADRTAQAETLSEKDAANVAAGEKAAEAVRNAREEQKAALAAETSADKRVSEAMKDQTQCADQGEQALVTLRDYGCPPPLLPASTEIAVCFGEAAPTDAELKRVQGRVQCLAQTQQTLETLRQRAAARDRHQSKLDDVGGRFSELTQSYPEERAQAIRAEHDELERSQREAAGRMAWVNTALAETAQQTQELEKQLQELEQARQAAQTERHTAEALAARLHDSVQGDIAALPPDWQERAKEAGESEVAIWRDELANLSGAEARAEALRSARIRLEQTEAHLLRVEGELTQIPPEAQQPLETLETREKTARTDKAQAERALEEIHRQRQELAARRDQIKELKAQKLTADKKASLYNQLAKYLGPNYLQRYLLQQAEATIVTLANETLDHCSGGALRMELRPNKESGASAQQAFDLIVHNSATSEQPLAAWLLSGSQRFRVAISLALGIGQYASQNGQRIESVIIDEGFGSLDRQGLRDMEEALRSLDDTLRRIILVSHQEEFATAFPHRYAIQLVDGASQARLVVGAEMM